MRGGTLRRPACLKHYVMALYGGYHFCMHDPGHTARSKRPRRPDRHLPHADPLQSERLLLKVEGPALPSLRLSVSTIFCRCSFSLDQPRGWIQWPALSRLAVLLARLTSSSCTADFNTFEGPFKCWWTLSTKIFDKNYITGSISKLSICVIRSETFIQCRKHNLSQLPIDASKQKPKCNLK